MKTLTFQPTTVFANTLDQSIFAQSREIQKGVDALWDRALRQFFDTVWPGEKPEDHAAELQQHGRFVIPQIGRGKSFAWMGQEVLRGDFELSMHSFHYRIYPCAEPLLRH